MSTKPQTPSEEETNKDKSIGIMVIFPKVDRDVISNGLRALTEAIVERHPELYVMGLLGGTFGYGARWDNKVFSMYPFCWCDKDDCPWCDYNEEIGEFPAPNFHHKKTDFKCWWYKYIGRSMETEGECDWPTVLAECLASVNEGEKNGQDRF